MKIFKIGGACVVLASVGNEDSCFEWTQARAIVWKSWTNLSLTNLMSGGSKERYSVPDMAPEFPPGTYKYFSVEFSSTSSKTSSQELESEAKKYYSALGFGQPRIEVKKTADRINFRLGFSWEKLYLSNIKKFELSDSLRLFSFPGLSSAGKLSGEPLCPFAECVLGDFSICTEDIEFYKPLCRSPCATGFCSEDARCLHPSATVPPKCFCLGAASSLTFGNRCEYSFPLWLFLVGTTFLVLIFLFIGAYFLKNSTQQKSQRLAQYVDEHGQARVELAPS